MPIGKCGRPANIAELEYHSLLRQLVQKLEIHPVSGILEMPAPGGGLISGPETSIFTRRTLAWWLQAIVAGTMVAALFGLQSGFGDLTGRTSASVSTLTVGLVLLPFLEWARYGIPWPQRNPWGRSKIRNAFFAGISCVTLLAFLFGDQADAALAGVKRVRSNQDLGSLDSDAAFPILDPERVVLLPRFSEKLTRAHQAPVSLIFVGSGAQLVQAFTSAGWEAPERVCPRTVLRSWGRGLLDRPYPEAPVTPVFLNGQLHDVAFNQADGSLSSRRRHHTRWWLTDFTCHGEQVWVATASFDTGVGFGRRIPIPIHHIDPDLDQERDYIVDSLTTSGVAAFTGKVRVTKPMTGRNAAGDHFFTEGIANVLSPVAAPAFL